MPIKNWIRNEEGSITVETAILFPVLIAVLLFGSACIRLCVDCMRAEQCFYDTAQVLSDYAYLYHEKTISHLTESWKNDLQEQSSSSITELLEGVSEELTGLFDLQGYLEAYTQDLLDQAESQIYLPIAHGVFQYYLLQSDLQDTVKHINFSGSSFFLDGHEILLELTCTVPFSVPFLGNQEVELHYRLHITAWVNGIGSTEEPVGEDIWELDNFSRGKKIRGLCDANLPDQFPTIARFSNGRATMIKSLDFRKETYQNAGAISQTVTAMLESLYAYQGQSTPYGQDQIVILPSQIREKELLLVIPKGEQSELVQGELSKVSRIAAQYGIIFTLRKL